MLRQGLMVSAEIDRSDAMCAKSIMYAALGFLIVSYPVSAEQYAFDSDSWQIQAEEAAVVDYLGQRALLMQGGSATLKGVELANGVIEFDIAVSPRRGFAGGFFRMIDPQNFEHFYIRPHQSGNPDANQYNPVFNGLSSWQLYHGEGFGTPVEYKFNEWMHIKIVYSGLLADIYIDSDTPSIRVRDLKRPVSSGGVGVDASNFAAAHFANFEVSPMPDDYMFVYKAVDPEGVHPETVMSWSVSDAFDGKSLDGVQQLGETLKDGRQWTSLAAGPGGITNLARIQGVAPDKDTAFVRLVITSDKKQLKGLSLGYSDAVAVFANDTLLYSGSNFYRSRDYRYLGTIGWFDKVYLPLEAGENEIWFAVAESFGGWGIQAQFDDLQGISVRPHP